MTLFRTLRSHDIIRRLQSRSSGLIQSALILLAASFVADLFPLGVMAATSLPWIIVRLVLQSMAAVVLVTWMWIVWDVLVDSLMKRKASPNFSVVRKVLILTAAAMIVLNALPHSNSSGGRSFGWPFRFLYGRSIVSPFAGILDLAHGLIVVALLLAIADRATYAHGVPAEPPATPLGSPP